MPQVLDKHSASGGFSPLQHPEYLRGLTRAETVTGVNLDIINLVPPNAQERLENLLALVLAMSAPQASHQYVSTLDNMLAPQSRWSHLLHIALRTLSRKFWCGADKVRRAI
jgi:hypothetical protein